MYHKDPLGFADQELEFALEAAPVKTFNTIKNVFAQVAEHVKFDAALATKIINFQTEFIGRNEDHITFFGGVLTGVQIVRFTSTDMNKFFVDVLGINESLLEEELHALAAVNADYKVSGDVFNHTCLWCVHGFLNSTTLSKPAAQRAALSAALILNYRYLTSLLAWYYKFPADPDLAQLAYSRLTKKSAIKQYGSWHALLEARCGDLFSGENNRDHKEGLHFNTVKDYSDDYAIIYTLNDHQNRIRSMMKHLMGELAAAKSSGSKLRSTSSTVEMDGEAFLRDKTRGLETYSNYIFSIMPDEHTFIKQEILGILSETIHTAAPSQVHETLSWMSKNFKTSRGKVIDSFIQNVMVHSFNYLGDNRTLMRDSSDLGTILGRLKGIYMSSRSVDPLLMKLRDESTQIVRNAITTRNEALISSVRTAIMLYVIARAFSMSYYSR